jgi:hypothetical protein
MAKKLIRLTESDLHRIVKESVNRILNEMDEGKVVNNKPYFKSSWSEGELPAEPGMKAVVPEDDPIEAEKARIHNERVPKNDPWEHDAEIREQNRMKHPVLQIFYDIKLKTKDWFSP